MALVVMVTWVVLAMVFVELDEDRKSLCNVVAEWAATGNLSHRHPRPYRQTDTERDQSGLLLGVDPNRDHCGAISAFFHAGVRKLWNINHFFCPADF
jgi:hypothetical protein